MSEKIADLKTTPFAQFFHSVFSLSFFAKSFSRSRSQKERKAEGVAYRTYYYYYYVWFKSRYLTYLKKENLICDFQVGCLKKTAQSFPIHYNRIGVRNAPPPKKRLREKKILEFFFWREHETVMKTQFTLAARPTHPLFHFHQLPRWPRRAYFTSKVRAKGPSPHILRR